MEMATNLTQMPNSFCPEQCELYTPEIENTKMFSNNDIYVTYNTLSCAYEHACKMWNEKYKKITEEE